MTWNGTDKRAVATGTVRGRVITLDAPVPGLEGRRVRVLLSPADDLEAPLNLEQNEMLWTEWIERGEHGPLDDEEGDYP